MVDVTEVGERIEERKDLGTDDAATWAYWMGQEAIAEREERKWIKRAREIVKRYRDERPESIQNTHRMNILWSNVETLRPTNYSRTPKPDVRRRFLDNGTPLARFAATLLEECLSFACNNDEADFDTVMKAVVEDRLLPGRGVARVLYVPHFGEPIEGALEANAAPTTQEATDDPDETNATFGRDESAPSVIDNAGDDLKKSEPARAVTYEEVIAKYVFWEDYREGPARQWNEVPWIRYRSYMTRDELIARFGRQKGKQVKLDYSPKGMSESVKNEPPPDLYKKAIVYEIWDKAKKSVIWIAPGTDDLVLDEQDDPLRLPDFFPNPNPLLANATNDKRIPVPDYVQYHDQARELDSLTARIDRLTRALKVSGVYPGEEKQVLQQLIDEGTDNRLIPVQDWQNWSDKGGLGSFIQWMPIQQVAETLIQLYNARDKTKALLYEITGIGDVMRGMTAPEETLGAQELKATFSTRRITPQQKEVAKFARNLLRLMAGVIAGHFSDKTISQITGYPQLAAVPPMPPPPPAPPPQVLVELAQARAQQQQQQSQQPPQQAPAGPAAAAVNAPVQQPGSLGAAAAPQLSPAAQAYTQSMMQYQQAAQRIQAIEADNNRKQQEFTRACAMIREDGVHGFKIDIEADSTIAPDEQAEKKARTEFLGAFVPLMEQIIPVAQGNPAMAELAKQITLFGVRGFPVARPLEDAIEKAFDAIAHMPPQPPKGGKGASSDPADLALRTKEDNTRLQIARETNAVKMANIAQDRQADAEKLEAERERDRTRLALDTQRGARQDALAGVRMTHIEARDAGQLA